MMLRAKVASTPAAFDADAIERALLARLEQELALAAPFATPAERTARLRGILAALRPGAPTFQRP